MGKHIVVLCSWTGKETFKKLTHELESNMVGGHSFTYLIGVEKKENLADIIVTDTHLPFTKKDFTLFGKIKNPDIRLALHNKNGVLLILETKNSFTKRIAKNSKLVSVGPENQLPLDIVLKGTFADNQQLYQKINEYITKLK
ncbi:MAG: hypothetical protein M9897_07360 [Brumimicrobium sp.]|nr:hypothetical protein [Brumimicrobium sp.]